MTEAAIVASLRSQCDGPRDGALLRFSLGNALLGQGDIDEAVKELRRATDFDPLYSAAWKVLGKACIEAGNTDDAADAWRCGIDAAMRRGDKQAEKEMTVFLRRLTQPKP
jgi:predicted Zn-dependent protease